LTTSFAAAVQDNVTNQSLGNVTDAGYGEIVREAGELSTVEHMQAVYDAFGLQLAIVALAPTVAIFFVGAALEREWYRDNYWIIFAVSGVVSVLGMILFPLLLLYL